MVGQRGGVGAADERGEVHDQGWGTAGDVGHRVAGQVDELGLVAAEIHRAAQDPILAFEVFPRGHPRLLQSRIQAGAARKKVVVPGLRGSKVGVRGHVPGPGQQGVGAGVFGHRACPKEIYVCRAGRGISVHDGVAQHRLGPKAGAASGLLRPIPRYRATLYGPLRHKESPAAVAFRTVASDQAVAEPARADFGAAAAGSRGIAGQDGVGQHPALEHADSATCTAGGAIAFEQDTAPGPAVVEAHASAIVCPVADHVGFGNGAAMVQVDPAPDGSRGVIGDCHVEHLAAGVQVDPAPVRCTIARDRALFHHAPATYVDAAANLFVHRHIPGHRVVADHAVQHEPAPVQINPSPPRLVKLVGQRIAEDLALDQRCLGHQVDPAPMDLPVAGGFIAADHAVGHQRPRPRVHPAAADDRPDGPGRESPVRRNHASGEGARLEFYPATLDRAPAGDGEPFDGGAGVSHPDAAGGVLPVEDRRLRPGVGHQVDRLVDEHLRAQGIGPGAHPHRLARARRVNGILRLVGGPRPAVVGRRIRPGR